jgi:cobalt transporter subunit CbtA
MINRVLAAGLVAGLAAGLIVALLQHFATTPLILAAEVYENEPAGGAERAILTSIATVGAAVGFAYLLLSGMLLSGEIIDERRALTWAAAAFVATGLAPAVGLAPELPGSAGADLASCQAWWATTAVCTALGVWLFLSVGGMWPSLLAAALVLAPHLIGAPHPHGFASKVPAELAARFAATSLALQAVLWAVVGYALGAVWPRLKTG